MKSYISIEISLLMGLCWGISAGAAVTLHLISASSEYNEKKIPSIIQMMKAKGFEVNTRYLQQQTSDFGYVESDQARGRNLVNALLDDKVKYLWLIRGGGGMLNLLPYLDANREALAGAKPKLIIGFSDVTALHDYINKHLHWPSVHGIMASGNRDLYQLIVPEIYQAENREYRAGMNNSVGELFSAMRDGIHYQGLLPLNSQQEQSTLHGTLYGGNLELIRSLFSTRFETGYQGNILLLEDVGVRPRHHQ